MMTRGQRLRRLIGRVMLIVLGGTAGLLAGWLAAEGVAGTETLASPPAEKAPAAAPAEPPSEAPKTHPGTEINPTGESIITPTREAPPSEDPKAAAEAIKPGQEIIRTLPHIVVDRKEKTVTLEGRVVLREGNLELFASAAGLREHESIVSLQARPLNIQLALLLLGLQSGNPATAVDGQFLPAAGPEIRVFVEYTKDGKQVRVEAHEWMMDELDQPAKPQRWVFAGSETVEQQFMADVEGTAVCVSNFASAILDLPFESPTINDQLVFKARKEAIPALGTPVKLILQPTGEVISGKKLSWSYVIDQENKITLEGRPSSPEDLAAKLEKRDKYLKKVEIYAHPKSHMEHTFAAMKVVSGHTSLQMQVLPLVDVTSPEKPAEAPGAEKPGEAPGATSEKPAPQPQEP